jgi:hypothetical protein
VIINTRTTNFLKYNLRYLLKGIAFMKFIAFKLIIFCSSAASSMDERDDEVPTTTAVAFSVNNSQPLSRRTRLLKVDSQVGVHVDGSYRPSSVDGG